MEKAIVYMTLNTITNDYYIGVHKLKSTSKRSRDYLGSGKRLNYAIKKYGRDNFKRETLYEFDTIEEAYKKEAELVTEELVKAGYCYNIRLGGEGGWKEHSNIGKVIVKDKDGNRFKICKTDPRYISGELMPYNKGIPQNKETNKKRGDALRGRTYTRPKIYCDVCKKEIANNRWAVHIQSKKHMALLD